MSPDTERLLRQASRKSNEWTGRRDALVRQAKDEGASLREIGAVMGMSHTGVKRILEREAT